MKSLVVLILLSGSISFGQPLKSVPQIGKPLPNFTLKDVKYYKDKTITNESLKGKWLILHFWSLGCSAAVNSLDQANMIQNAFENDLQVVLIGHKYGEMNVEGIERVFERKRRTNSYNLPVVYDTLLYRAWSLKGVPTIYIIDPQGVLRYVTSGSDMTLEKVRSILIGREVSLRPMHFEYSQTSIIDLFSKWDNYENAVYVSALTHWRGEYPRLGYELDRFIQLPDQSKRDGWSVTMATLTRLYQYAYYGQGWFFMADVSYYGKVYERPILEVRDKTPFIVQNFESGEGYYNYFIKLPLEKITKVEMMREMKATLKRIFGYHAEVETRKMPVWRLEAKPEAFEALRTKGGKAKFYGINSVAGVKVRNYAIKDFLRLVTANLPNDERIPFLDDTGIGFGVDANVQTDMTDFGSVQKALKLYGLELVKGSKEMRVLVIRDCNMPGNCPGR